YPPPPQAGGQIPASRGAGAPAAAAAAAPATDAAPGPDMQQADDNSPPPEPVKPPPVEPEQIPSTPVQEKPEVEAPPEQKVQPTPPEPAKTEPTKVEPAKVEPVEPEPVVMPKPRPKREPKPPSRQPPAPRTSAPPPAERHAASASLATRGETAVAVLPSYRDRLAAHLQRFKRYPSGAKSSGAQGTALLSFTVGRNGRVLGSRLARSSGNAALDAETLAMIRRAEPLPAFPPQMTQSSLSFTVPVRFSLR
ncbi:energy transducer TonB, partial [Rhodopseudomonas sp. BAL398]|uniref:energy transducer TonB family protein n=1 Tax=Rhodopseudomonas sp. BAL398 TaxID=3034676 RepID=UPI0023E15CD7